MDEAERKPSVLLRMSLILAAALVVILPTINTRDLWEPEELRYAEIAREMMERDDWALLTLNYNKYPDKPPLFFWSLIASAKLFGGITPISMRAVNITCGILCILITYLFGRRLIGERAGLLGAFVLLSVPYFAWTSAEARMDTMLTLFIMLSLWCFWQNYHRNKRGWLLAIGFGIFAGLATLTKGPIGFIFPLLTALCFSLVERKPREFFNRHLIAFPIAVAALVLPWLVIACKRGGPEFTRNILFMQNVGRAVLKWKHPQPFYHFLHVVPMILMPWTVLMPAMFYNIFTAERSRRQGLFFLLCWFAVIFLFFSACRGKRTIYMVPLLPAAALMIGGAFDAALSARQRGERFRLAEWGFFIIPLLTVSLGVVALLVPLLAKLGCLELLSAKWKLMREIKSLETSLYLGPLIAVLAIAILGMLFSMIMLARGRWKTALAATMAAIMLSFVTGSLLFLPKVNRFKSARLLTESLALVAEPGQPLSTYISDRWGYMVYWPERLPTIYDREALHDYLSAPRRVFCLGLAEYWDDHPILEDGRAFVVWTGRCGGRFHVLLTNTLGIPQEEEARRFLVERDEPSCVELPGCILLLSACKGELTGEDSVRLEFLTGRPLVRFYPKPVKQAREVVITLPDIQPERYEITAEEFGTGKPLTLHTEPTDTGLRISVLVEKPCQISFKRRQE